MGSYNFIGFHLQFPFSDIYSYSHTQRFAVAFCFMLPVWYVEPTRVFALQSGSSVFLPVKVISCQSITMAGPTNQVLYEDKLILCENYQQRSHITWLRQSNRPNRTEMKSRIRIKSVECQVWNAYTADYVLPACIKVASRWKFILIGPLSYAATLT